MTRAFLWGTAHYGLILFDKWVEFVLYPLAMGTQGLVRGMAIMIVFSLVVCWLLLAFYDWVSTIDHTNIRNPHLRTFVEALSDALGFETMKEKGAEIREELFVPVVVEPAINYRRIRIRWYGLCVWAHRLHAGFLLRYLRMLANLTLYVWALFRNARLRLWEPIRSRLIAPMATWLFERKLEKVGLYLYVSLFHDGMTCLILMRPAHCHKMGAREWMLFVPSVILSCLGWGTLVWGFIGVARWLAQL